MKIRSLYIENFGGLCRHEMSFEDGLNVLCLPNGWGKSTLSVFIKAMLYGLPVSTKRSLIENERKRYTPWQGGVFGGSMVIEIDGTSYRIERTFGAKESEDTLSVCDAITGEEIGGFSGELSPGEQLLGVDAAAYERSTYLSQRQLQGDDGELSIHAKLNRLVDATDDLASYDAAMEILEKQRKYYTVSGGRRGAIADTEAGIYALKEQIDQARHAAAQAEGLSSRIVALEMQLLQNEKEQRALHDSETEYHRKGETVAKQRHYQALRTALTQKQTQLAAMLHGVGGESPTDEQIDALKQAQHRAQEHRHTLASLELEASALMPTEEQSAYKSVPDERALEELRVAAEEAQRTQMLCLSLREGAEPTQEREEPLPTADELARMRGVCLRYGTERAENVELAKEQTWTIKSLQATAARAKKYACLLGAVAVLL